MQITNISDPVIFYILWPTYLKPLKYLENLVKLRNLVKVANEICSSKNTKLGMIYSNGNPPFHIAYLDFLQLHGYDLHTNLFCSKMAS